MGREDALLLFLHIPKTAGTTLARYFYSAYQPEGPVPPEEELRHGSVNYGIYHEHAGFESDDPAPPPSDLMQVLSRPDIRVAMGHFAYGVHTLQPRPATYTTMVRRPVERVLSVAYHVLSWTEDPQRSVPADEMEEYLVTNRLTELDNGQTRRISGLAPPFGECTTATLDAAKKNLAEHFSIVGLTERFDESLVVFKNMLGWDLGDVYWLPRQVNPGRPPESALSPDVLEHVAAQNALDIELYEHAAGIFEELVARQGPGFDDDVAELESLREAQIREWGYY